MEIKVGCEVGIQRIGSTDAIIGVVQRASLKRVLVQVGDCVNHYDWKRGGWVDSLDGSDVFIYVRKRAHGARVRYRVTVFIDIPGVVPISEVSKLAFGLKPTYEVPGFPAVITVDSVREERK